MSGLKIKKLGKSEVRGRAGSNYECGYPTGCISYAPRFKLLSDLPSGIYGGTLKRSGKYGHPLKRATNNMEPFMQARRAPHTFYTKFCTFPQYGLLSKNVSALLVGAMAAIKVANDVCTICGKVRSCLSTFGRASIASRVDFCPRPSFRLTSAWITHPQCIYDSLIVLSSFTLSNRT